MNIALVHYSAAPVVGGVERVMEEHARLFTAHGHRVTTVCATGGGAGTVRLPAEKSAQAQLDALRPLLARQDVVMAHNVMTMPFHLGLTEALARLAVELPRVRFIAWVHDVAGRNPDYKHTPPLIRTVHPHFEYVAVSPLRATDFQKVTHDPVLRCRVVPNGFDPARVLGLPPGVADFAHKHSLLDGRIILLHPARVLRRKGIEKSLAVGQALRSCRIPATVLVTAADDPHRPEPWKNSMWLRWRASGGSGILVSDHLAVGDAELAGLYLLADALLFPSRREGFGLPLLEAAMHRLPVLCSDIAPLRDLLKENVTLFPLDAKAPEIAARIAAVLDASPSYRERKRMLREYSWPAIFRCHLAGLLAAP